MALITMPRTFKVSAQLPGEPDTWAVIMAGIYTTKGGNATEVAKFRGVMPGDICLFSINTLGTGSRTLTTAVAGKNSVTLVFSGDPAANHKLNYVILRNRKGVSAAQRTYDTGHPK